jgi:hypothetical protein
VERVREAVPGASANFFEVKRDGVAHLCASSLATPSADTVDLCLEVRVAHGRLVVAADLVVGGTGEVLGSLDDAVAMPGGQLPVAFVDFIDEQERRIIDRLKRP